MAAKSHDIMTMDELAEYLKISKSTLYKLAVDNKLPGQKIGKRWRFHKEAWSGVLGKSWSADTDTSRATDGLVTRDATEKFSLLFGPSFGPSVVRWLRDRARRGSTKGESS